MKHRKENWDAEDDKTIGQIWSKITLGLIVVAYNFNLYLRIKRNANPSRELTSREALSKLPLHYSMNSEYSWENLGRMGDVKHKLDKSRSRLKTQAEVVKEYQSVFYDEILSAVFSTVEKGLAQT